MSPAFQILQGDALATMKGLQADSVDCCVTSPPYFGLRDYGVEGQMGLEPTPEAFVQAMVEVFREVRRVLKPTGTLWLNLGDSYAGARKGGHPSNTSTLRGPGSRAPRIASRRRDNEPIPRSDRALPGLKAKDLIGIPWMVAFALRADGWYLRRDIVWNKPNPMPESAKDRPTTAHEYIFLLAKSGRPTIWRARDTGEWLTDPDLTQRLPAPTDDDPDATEARWRGFDYFFDAAAIAEPLAESTLREVREGYEGQATKDYEGAGVQNPSAVKARIIAGKRKKHALRDGVANRGGNQGRGEMPVSNGLTRNKRSVWTIPTKPFKGAHFATFPEALVEPCILAGCPEGGLVLDPFAGSGTVGAVALRHFRRFLGIELNPAYAEMATRRVQAAVPGPYLFQEPA